MHARILGCGRYTGKKDLGKSSIAAYLARNRPSVIAYHFAHAGDRSSNDARRALLSLCYQLCTQFAEEDMMEPLLHRKSLEDDVCVMDVQSLYRALISVRTGVLCEIDSLQSSLSAGLKWCFFCSFGSCTHPEVVSVSSLLRCSLCRYQAMRFLLPRTFCFQERLRAAPPRATPALIVIDGCEAMKTAQVGRWGVWCCMRIYGCSYVRSASFAFCR
jgi:hypothetical protein